MPELAAKCPAKVISRVGSVGRSVGPRLHNVPIDLSADDLIKYRRTALGDRWTTDRPLDRRRRRFEARSEDKSWAISGEVAKNRNIITLVPVLQGNSRTIQGSPIQMHSSSLNQQQNV